MNKLLICVILTLISCADKKNSRHWNYRVVVFELNDTRLLNLATEFFQSDWQTVYKAISTLESLEHQMEKSSAWKELK